MDLLAGLNTAQAQAVSHRGGALMVLAGPGTGKTRVITHRIASLLIDDGVEPESVVALTFTVKAAEQMRRRLAELLGPSRAELAQRVQVRTFHGLGQRLIRRFADAAGVSPRFGLIDSAQQSRLLRAVIVEHGLYPDAPAQGIEAALGQARAVVEWLGNHGIEPGEALAHARAWSASLRDTGEERASERARAERFERLAHVAQRYQERLGREGLVSFDDLITRPTRMLREHAGVRAIVRGECRHAVVDEYQDVNPAQVKLLRAIWPGDERRGPDLCVVGDDDQTIYQFRGSDDLAMVRFDRLWPGARQVRLTENYRSEGPILRVSAAVIARQPVRAAPDKALTRPAGRQGEPDAPGTLVLGVRMDEEGTRYAQLCAAMLKDYRAREPERPWSHYAVVARSHGDLERVATALRLEGIPFEQRSGTAVAQDEGVQDVLAYARAVLEPINPTHVRRLLTRPPLSMDPARVGELERAYLAQRSHFDHGDPEVSDPGEFLPWACAREPEARALALLRARVEELRSVASSERADRVITRIVSVSGVTHSELLPAGEHARRVGAIVTLLRFVVTRQERLEEPGDLRALLDYYQDLSSREQDGLGNEERVDRDEGEEEDEGERRAQGVQLLTAHASKGLEFDTVLVVRATPPAGFGKSRVDEPLDLPPSLFEGDDPRTPQQRVLAEERRLFYVALTRAQRRLIILGKCPAKTASLSHYLHELANTDPALLPMVEAADMLRQAGHAGDAALELELAAYAGVEDLHERIGRVRAELRAGAGGALNSVDDPACTSERLRQAASQLERAAAGLAIVADIERTGREPDWAGAGSAHASLAKEILTKLTGAAPRAGGVLLAAPRPPLKLSYTYLSDYRACPRCFYCKHVLRVPEIPSDEIRLGTVAHAVLCRHVEKWMLADAEGRPGPGLEELLADGERAFFADAAGKRVEKTTLDRLRGQLRMAHALHDPTCQIIEKPEWALDVPYAHAGCVHTLKAKLDRVERLGDGGVRIVDYKTGEPWKSLIEPKNDDLQMGIYALALDHALGGGEPVRGRGEYWVLSTGQRGVVDLAQIKRDKIRQRIDEVIQGVLSGQFDRGSNCRGSCEVLGLGEG